jgi:apolipoprotein N-acyltransferase
VLLKSEERKLQRVFLKVWPETIIIDESRKSPQEKKIQKKEKKEKISLLRPLLTLFQKCLRVDRPLQKS